MTRIKIESYREHPYWWDSGPGDQSINLDLLATSADEIPLQADCVIVGAS